MREETIVLQIYPYSELSDAAKEHAHYEHLSGGGFYDFYTEESLESLKAFVEHLGFEIRDYSIGTCSHSYIDTDITDDTEEEIRIAEVEYRLKGWDFVGEFDDLVMELRELPADYPEKFKKVSSTGHFMDDTIIYLWNEPLAKHPKDNIGAFKAVVDGALVAMLEDLEHLESQEYFAEYCEEDEREFLEDGTRH